jgi:MFS family permease
MPTPRSIQRTYLLLLLGNTLAASFIWGINTIFLLDAGLSNLEAFAANAFFTAGMVVFEVPTGIVADTIGRRASYLLGTVTLSGASLLYVMLWQIEGPFWAWAVVSLLLGLGFTFFSGAVEAWLVDALTATGFTGEMETVFGRGQVVTGVGMLTGSVAGGFIAAVTSLGVPFVLRAAVLIVMFGVAFRVMHDIGFAPEQGGRPLTEMRKIASASIDFGWRVPAVKWLMVEALFTGGVGIYAFYALQPYLLELYGDPEAYQIAGLVAAIIAGAQILGGVAAPRLRRLFDRRTSALIATASLSVLTLGLIGIVEIFWVVVGLIVMWGLLFAAELPIRQTYLNGMIPSRQRATIISFDSLMASTGGVWAQPVLGRAADV